MTKLSDRVRAALAVAIGEGGALLASIVPDVNVPYVHDAAVAVFGVGLAIGGLVWAFRIGSRVLSSRAVTKAAITTVNVNLLLDQLLDQLRESWRRRGGQHPPDREMLGASVFKVFGGSSGDDLIRVVRRRSDRAESMRSWPANVGVAGVAWERGKTNPHAEALGRFDPTTTAEQWAALLARGEAAIDEHFNMPYEDFIAVRGYTSVVAVPIMEPDGGPNRRPGVVGVLTIDCMSAAHDICHTSIVASARRMAVALRPSVEAWPSELRGTLSGVVADVEG